MTTTNKEPKSGGVHLYYGAINGDCRTLCGKPIPRRRHTDKVIDSTCEACQVEYERRESANAEVT